MNCLTTVLHDKDGNVIENATEDFSSLAEIRCVMAAKDEIRPGCAMWVWKSNQDPMHDVPYKIIHAPQIQRRKAGHKPYWERAV